ncbi:hypothetical protein Pan216_22690 [Planctomycetes bacterium Pan216]|uniref:Chromosome partition protein Smc n=1 Tax=Kolteria novifilia TaxID=2527975 RepID=A0A518B338_9BACT|nr:hypothetical protein Pan216_22690 [Planctomycetes bacterium Pan216]
MREEFLSRIASVRRRQHWSLLQRAMIRGLLISSLAGILLGGWRLFTHEPITTPQMALILLLGPALSLLLAFARLLAGDGTKSAASAIDRQFGLKDRILTALEFLRGDDSGTLQSLQIEDATDHLRRADPKRVVSLVPAREFYYGLGACCLAVGLLVIPLPTQEPLAASPVVLPHIEQISRVMAEDLDELDQLAQEEKEVEFQELVEELREQTRELEQPGVDEHEALAKLSEMEASIATLQSEHNVAAVDAALASLGDAMSAAPALAEVADALKKGDHDKAAESLESLEQAKLSRKEAKAVADRMMKVAKRMSDNDMGQTSSAVRTMCEGMCDNDGTNKRMCQGARMLAKRCRSQSRRKRIGFCLQCQLARLSECKGNCNKNSYVRLHMPKKSTRSSQSFAMSSSGNVDGEKTNLLSQRQREEITGIQGEGPSSVETSSAPETRQQAGRGFREVYGKYRKLSETVLESEPIPLGHRQTIRRYFELIRPDRQDLDAMAPPAP